MYLIENPVLQRELLVNLRMTRAFVLLFLYQALLGVVVFFAWPDEEQLNLSGTSGEGQRLGDLFFSGAVHSRFFDGSQFCCRYDHWRERAQNL